MATQRDAFEKGVFVHLHHGILGIRRKVKIEKIEVKDDGPKPEQKVDKKMLNLTKSIIECEEYRIVARLIEDSKSYMRKMSIHMPYYREGYYFVPFERGEETLAGLEEWNEKINGAADAFVKTYERAKADARSRLKHLYVEDEYPPARLVRSKIYMGWDITDEVVPKRLSKLGDKIFKAQLRKQETQASSLVDEMKYDMRKQFQELIAHLADRLAPDAKGERKVFHSSAIKNVDEWLKYFEPKNGVVGDAQLAAAAGTVRKLISGVDVEQVKDDEEYRKRLQQDMTAIKSSLDKLLEDKPKRLIAARGAEV